MSKKWLASFAVAVAAWLTSAMAYAADGSSGCGLGWYVFKKNSLVSSTLRSTTNALFFNQTFGMTFGTSNCAKHSIIMNDKKSLHYLESNLDNLMLASARGRGEHLGTLAATLGCGWQAQGAFNANLQRNFDTIFSQVPTLDGGIAAANILLHVKYQIAQDPALAATCSAAHA